LFLYFVYRCSAANKRCVYVNKIIKPCSMLSTVRGQPQHHAYRKTQKAHVTLTIDRWPWNSIRF